MIPDLHNGETYSNIKSFFNNHSNYINKNYISCNKLNKKIMYKFKKGDKVKILDKTVGCCINDCCDKIGNIFEIIGIEGDGSGKDIDNCICVEGHYYHPQDLKLINKLNNKKIMTNVIQTIKNLTRKEPEKTFIKVGFMDENENITEDGKEVLEHILWEKNKEKLKEYADKLNEENNKK